MNRRAFIAGLGGVVVLSVIARAKEPPIRIGFLSSGAADSLVASIRTKALKGWLRENGLIEGRDYTLELRFASGHYERFPELAQELSKADVRVILTNTIVSVKAAQRLTPPVPIVMIPINDPVGAGLISSLSHPGGHTTGVASLFEDLTPKLLDYQRAILPESTRIAALFNPANPSNPIFVEELRTRAAAVGVLVLPIPVQSPETLDAALAALKEHDADALQLIGDSGTLDLSDRIAAWALANRRPSFATAPIYAECGGLLGYGAPTSVYFARAAYYVKRILDGANPGDLPVEQPTKIELWINLKTAKLLGVTVPQTLLATADEVIE